MPYSKLLNPLFLLRYSIRLILLASFIFAAPLIALAQENAPPLSKILRIGDILALSLPGEEALTKEFALDRDGRINLPEIGAIPLAGKSLKEATKTTIKALSRAYKDLNRFEMHIKERRLIVMVAGQVLAPGTFNLPGDASVQVAIARAGGIAEGARLDNFKIIRGDETLEFNYKKYLDDGDLDILPQLKPLDIVFVPASPLTGNVKVELNPASLDRALADVKDENAVKIFGEVHEPSQFSWNSDTTVMDIIMRAGGVTRYASVEQIRVFTNGKPQIFNLQAYLDNGDASLMPPLEAGSTIFVPIHVEQIRKGKRTVYVMGEVARPGAFEMQKGVGFIDIMANSGGPTRFADTKKIRILHPDSSVEAFDMLAFTDGNGGTLPKIQAGDAILVPEKIATTKPSWLKIPNTRAVYLIGAVVNPGRIEWSDEMTLFDLIAQGGGPNERGDLSAISVLSNNQLRANPVHFNLKEFIHNGGDMRDVPIVRAGYTVFVPELPQDPSDNKAQWLLQSAERSIYITGAVGSPGRFAFDRSMGFLDILGAADGPTPNADLRRIHVVFRGAERSKPVIIDLVRYLETGDERLLPDVRPGDVIHIPVLEENWLEESPQTTVRVIGSVRKQGRYRYGDHMSILDVLAQAGGPDAQALQSRIIVVNMEDDARASFFDLEAFSRDPDYSLLPPIRAGDTIYVPDKTQSHWHRFMSGVKDAAQIVALIAAVAAL